MLLHGLAPHIRRLPFVPESVSTSFSGGFAVAFVFLHMLPGLLEHRETLGEALSEVVEMTPLLDLSVFLIALVGFTVYLGLERWAQVGSAAPGGNSRRFFFLHLASYAVYNGLITYTLPLRIEVGPAFALIFTVAMGLHFVIHDRGMELHHPRLFDHQGRITLVSALLGGWILAALTEPANVEAVAFLSSFLGGSVLLNVFKEEVPSDRRSSFGAFVLGLAAGTILLATVIALEG